MNSVAFLTGIIATTHQVSKFQFCRAALELTVHDTVNFVCLDITTIVLGETFYACPKMNYGDEKGKIGI